MNGCAAAFVYFTFILPASIALDFAFGTEGMLTVLGLIFGFCWLVARSNKAQQDDSAGAPDQPRSYYGYGDNDDAQHRARTPEQTRSYYGYGNEQDTRHSADETTLRSELTALQQQIAALQSDVRAIEMRLARLATQPATARAMPLDDIRRYIHTPLPTAEPAPPPPTPDKETDSVWAYDLPDVATTPATTPPKVQDKPAAARTVAPEIAAHYRPAQPAINYSEPAPRPAAPANNNDNDIANEPNPLTAWLSENLLLKTGIAILFLGLAFLLRYASASPSSCAMPRRASTSPSRCATAPSPRPPSSSALSAGACATNAATTPSPYKAHRSPSSTSPPSPPSNCTASSRRPSPSSSWWRPPVCSSPSPCCKTPSSSRKSP